MPAIHEDRVQRIGDAALGAPLKILAVVLCRIPGLNGSEAFFLCIQIEIKPLTACKRSCVH